MEWGFAHTKFTDDIDVIKEREATVQRLAYQLNEEGKRYGLVLVNFGKTKI